MSNFPPELIFDILVCLPPKELIRCMCVSKSFNALIHDHRFIKSHLQRATETNNSGNATVLLTTSVYKKSPGDYYRLCFNDSDTSGRVVKIEQPLQRPHASTYLLGKCNGLVCIHNNNDKDIALWNPTIQRFKKVPFPTFELEPLEKLGHVRYGFGYDSMNDDYKIVGIMEFSNSDYSVMSSVVKVYSLKSNSWKTIQSMPCIGFEFCMSKILFANGALSWLMRNQLDEDRYVIQTLDLASESYREFTTPVDGNDDSTMTLDVLGDSLCLCVNYFYNRTDVWIMTEYGVTESWTMLYSTASLPWRDINSTLSKTGEIVFPKKDYDEISCSDLEKMRAKYVKIRGLSGYFAVTICVGSLCLLDGDPVVVRRQQKAT